MLETGLDIFKDCDLFNGGDNQNGIQAGTGSIIVNSALE